MIRLGYALSGEEHDAPTLITHAARAEQAGFSFALVSDHYHPWINQQGESPFVWAVLGGIAQQTQTIQIGTGVTCPIIRMHPAIIAQAAATVGQLLEDRFFLGVGTGENLNEHVIGQGWPPIGIRQQMLREAIQIIRLLWEGKNTNFNGEFYTVEDARIYSLPATLPKIMVAASGPFSTILAAQVGDGFITTSPNRELVQTFEETAGTEKPKYGQITVCVAKNETDALKTAMKWWPNSAIPGQFSQEARIPAYFEQAAKLVTPDHIKKNYVLGADPKKHLEEIKKYADAGFDHIYIHQIGPDQEAFFTLYEKEILPQIKTLSPARQKNGRKRGRPKKNGKIRFSPSL